MKERTPYLSGIFAAGAALILSLTLRSVFPKLSALLLAAVCVSGAVFVLLLGAVIFFAFWKPKATPEETESLRRADLVKHGRSQLVSARMARNRIRESRVREVSAEVCDQMEKILRTLGEQPEDIPKAGLLFSYYLPTLKKILEKYAYLESRGAADSALTETAAQCLGDIQTAMEQQYESLFADDVLDLTVEMQTLTQICKRNGLLPENE